MEVPQHDARMVPAFRQLTDLVNSDRLAYGNGPALNAAVENSVQQQARRARVLARPATGDAQRSQSTPGHGPVAADLPMHLRVFAHVVGGALRLW